MPKIDLSPEQLSALQILFDREGIDIPDADDIPDFETWGKENDLKPGIAREQYPHEFAEEKALRKLGAACPVCGRTECDGRTAYVGSQMIHWSDHPENRTGRRF